MIDDATLRGVGTRLRTCSLLLLLATFSSVLLGCGTSGDSTATVDSPGRSTIGVETGRFGQGPIVSAFFGLDNAMPANSAGLCAGAPGRDGLVVNVTDRLDPDSITPVDWIVTTASGIDHAPICATLRPALDPDERRTVLLIGDLGSVDDPPVKVRIVGGVRTVDPAKSAAYVGATTAKVTSLAEGPELVMAESIASPLTGGPTTGSEGCPAGIAQAIRVAWAGGVSRPDGSPTTDRDAAAYRVIVNGAAGGEREVMPIALADVNDNDNYHVLCLDDADRAESVRAEAGSFVDPNHDPNPPTSIRLH